MSASEPLPSAPEPLQKPRRRFRRILFRLGLIVLLLGAAAFTTVLIIYGQMARQYDISKLGEMRQRSVVLDTKGRELGKLHGENRVVVPLSEVSPYFTKALLVREDARFYKHGGVDYLGVLRAFVRNLKDSKAVQGASTLTMQLARNSFDGLNAKTLNRKLVEVMLARRIEAEKSKDEILELYVNRIFFGSGLYGIERASKAYFAKSARDLTPGEAAMLAGIIRSPNRFSPFRNWKGALKERDDVLKRMVATNTITPAEADAAMKEDIVIAALPVIRSQDNYMMEAVRRDLELILNDQDVEDGGLTIVTTLDKDIQAAAESSLEKRLKDVEAQKGYNHPSKAQFDAQWDGVTEPTSIPYLQGAVLAVNNHTGGILAVVGGRDYAQSRFDRALQGNRPIGSTIKPFIYAAAFQQGLLPGTLVEDAPIRPGEVPESDWSPANSDGKFLGWVPAGEGLVRSRNAMTVRVGNYAGMENVLALLRDAGLGDPQVITPQIYIGNMGTTLKALTSAMTAFPNGGVRRRSFIIERITDAEGEVLYSTPVLEAVAMPHYVADVTGKLMEKVVDKGTASAARTEYGFKEKAGGKTGTTNDYKDAWFVGYTSEITCGVWVGMDIPQTIASQGYGGKLALPVWADVMKAGVELNYKSTTLKAEAVESPVLLCRVSGQLATEACRQAGQAYEDELPVEMIPQGACGVHGGGIFTRNESPAKKEGFFGKLFRWFK
ncbi:MAG: transglycosylase domain-containing protein [Verrucomicrobium sp.]|nr:transglycosylase domain-containing protein [Verrucomicrobium sp.]